MRTGNLSPFDLMSDSARSIAADWLYLPAPDKREERTRLKYLQNECVPSTAGKVTTARRKQKIPNWRTIFFFVGITSCLAQLLAAEPRRRRQSSLKNAAAVRRRKVVTDGRIQLPERKGTLPSHWGLSARWHEGRFAAAKTVRTR